MKEAILESTVISDKERQGAKFKDYFEWQEPAATAPSHRILAIRRGENEGILDLAIQPPKKSVMAALERQFVKNEMACAVWLRAAIEDGYKRLMLRSMETEIRVMLKEHADGEAINVFGDNLRELLMVAPLGAKRVMAVDPGFRTGCKVVCLDRQGKLLHDTVVYPL